MQIICTFYLFFIPLRPKSQIKNGKIYIPVVVFKHKNINMIGIFDSGYGGLTILNQIRKILPQYSYLYLGDNARAPYGTRSFDVIYEYTLQAVNYLHQHGCNLIVLACNTASAKALRTIQQNNIDPNQLRVLGVIRPTVEAIPALTQNKHIGVLATPGTIASESYTIELLKQDPELIITQQACPMWVPLIESGEFFNTGADYFIEKYLSELLNRDPEIDTIILGCTHYPILQPKIEAFLSKNHRTISIVSQGEIVAHSLQDYLHRHNDIAQRCLINENRSLPDITYLTTESASRFAESASIFLNLPILAQHIEL